MTLKISKMECVLCSWLEGNLSYCIQWVNNHLDEMDDCRWLALMLSDALWRQCPSLFPALEDGLFVVRQRTRVLREHLQQHPHVISEILDRGHLRGSNMHPSAMCLRAMEKYHTTNRKEDSVPLFTESAEAGHSHAQWYLGTIYGGKNSMHDTLNAQEMFQMSAIQGHVSSMWYLSMYATSQSEKISLLEQAVSLGDVSASRDLADMLIESNGPNQDIRRAMEIWRSCPILFYSNIKTMRAIRVLPSP
jgi:hypothetical protein